MNLLNILYYFVQRCIASSNNNNLDTKSHLSTEIVLTKKVYEKCLKQKSFCLETCIGTKSIKTVVAKFCRQYNFNHFPNKSMIYRWIKKFKSKGTVLKLTARSEKVITRRHLGVRVRENVDAVRTSVGRSPRKSTQRRSQECIVTILNTSLKKFKQQNF